MAGDMARPGSSFQGNGAEGERGTMPLHSVPASLEAAESVPLEAREPLIVFGKERSIFCSSKFLRGIMGQCGDH